MPNRNNVNPAFLIVKNAMTGQLALNVPPNSIKMNKINVSLVLMPIAINVQTPILQNVRSAVIINFSII